MTRDEFEQGYAERAGMTVEQLRERRTVIPCLCGEEGCHGWQALPHELAQDPLIRYQAGIGSAPE